MKFKYGSCRARWSRLFQIWLPTTTHSENPFVRRIYIHGSKKTPKSTRNTGKYEYESMIKQFMSFAFLKIKLNTKKIAMINYLFRFSRSTLRTDPFSPHSALGETICPSREEAVIWLAHDDKRSISHFSSVSPHFS